MGRFASPLVAGIVATLLAVAPSGSVPGGPQPPPRAATATSPALARDEVFVGGYFYNPAFGRYPWWVRGHYPYWYEPVYDERAVVRLRVFPDDTAVYVDGFYAGLADDFDDASRALPLPPGSHAVLFHRPGYRSQRHHVYLRPASRLMVAIALDRLEPGELAELRPAVLRVPAPPAGSYRLPVVRWGGMITAGPEARPIYAAIGWLELETEPSSAGVTIDGEPWWTSAPGRLVADLAVGTHHVRVAAPGLMEVDRVIQIEAGTRKSATVRLVPGT